MLEQQEQMKLRRIKEKEEFYRRQYTGQPGLNSQFIYGNGDDK